MAQLQRDEHGSMDLKVTETKFTLFHHRHITVIKAAVSTILADFLSVFAVSNPPARLLFFEAALFTFSFLQEFFHRLACSISISRRRERSNW